MAHEVSWRQAARDAFARAIEKVGGQLDMAKGLNPKNPPPQSTISYWLNDAKYGVPPQHVMTIEILAGEPGLRHLLRPDVFGAPPEAATPVEPARID